MQLHPLAAHFDEVAGAYERGRPAYTPGVAGLVAAELQIGAGERVLDLGAGTGKLTRALLACGLDVIAVEPQASLRALLSAGVGEQHVTAGVAEAIPLPDGSVAAVTAADSFHWFDAPAALAEIRRVLRPQGGLARMSATVDWGGASWAHEVGTIVASLRPEHPNFDGPSFESHLAAAGGWTRPREIQVSFPHPADPQQVLDHIASMSWIAALPEGSRAETLERIAALIGSGQTPADMPVRVNLELTSLL